MSLQKHTGNRPPNIDESDEGWLSTYADMITLLMAFFLVLISISKVDVALFEQLKQGLQQEIAKKERVETPLAKIKRDLDSLLVQERSQEKVSIDLGRTGITMQFASSAFYGPGRADIGREAKRIIDKVVGAINNITYYPFQIDIEGHTDNVPINTLRFPSNWELSVARATTIVKYCLSKGVPSDRLKAAGYADTKPIVPNQTKSGKNISKNQSMNRRIVIRIH
ncbi:MAG: OmpA family protein [Fibrobacterales bacterium]